MMMCKPSCGLWENAEAIVSAAACIIAEGSQRMSDRTGSIPVQLKHAGIPQDDKQRRS